MKDHQLIQDLFEVYLSGEASKETKKEVEEHLTECDKCQKALEQARVAEEALSSLEEVEKPTNGKRYVSQLRRVLYGVGAGILTLLVILLAIVEFVAFKEVLGIQVPRLQIGLGEDLLGGSSAFAITVYLLSFWLQKKQKGEAWMWTFLRVVSLIFIGIAAIEGISVADRGGSIFIGLVMLAFYIYLLDWRAKLPPGSNRTEFLHSLETAIPLFVLGIGLGGAKDLGSIIFLSLFLLVALSITLIRLPKLRYMSLATTLVMLATVGVVAGQAIFVVLNTLDMFPVIPSALGHPPANADLKEYVTYENNSLGMNLQSTDSIVDINGIPIKDATQAYQSEYLVSKSEGRNDMISRITVIEFSNVGAAREFIDEWYPCQPQWECDHTVDLDMEETLLFEGRFLRFYDNDTALAHNAWQTVTWITIIETEGTFIDAMPLNKEIREMIESRYRNGLVDFREPVIEKIVIP